MKGFLFNGEFDADGIQSIINFVNANEGELSIGIWSGGGRLEPTMFLTDFLNFHKDRITLTAVAGVFSAAFELFYFFKGKKKLHFGSKGMTHYGQMMIRYKWNNDTTDAEYKIDKDFFSQQKKRTDKEGAKFMTVDELKRFKKGEDVYFDFNRMKEIFPNAEII